MHLTATPYSLAKQWGKTRLCPVPHFHLKSAGLPCKKFLRSIAWNLGGSWLFSLGKVPMWGYNLFLILGNSEYGYNCYIMIRLLFYQGYRQYSPWRCPILFDVANSTAISRATLCHLLVYNFPASENNIVHLTGASLCQCTAYCIWQQLFGVSIQYIAADNTFASCCNI